MSEQLGWIARERSADLGVLLAVPGVADVRVAPDGKVFVVSESADPEVTYRIVVAMSEVEDDVAATIDYDIVPRDRVAMVSEDAKSIRPQRPRPGCVPRNTGVPLDWWGRAARIVAARRERERRQRDWLTEHERRQEEGAEGEEPKRSSPSGSGE
jgi:hypothetical protein